MNTTDKPADPGSRADEQLYRAIAAHLPGGAVFVVDHDLRYLLAEGEALYDAGLSPGDLEGKTIFEALEPDLAGACEPTYRQALAGESFQWEHRAHNHIYLTHGTPLRDKSGEVYAALAVSYDITEHRKIEEARERLLEEERMLSEELRHLNETLEQRVRERTAALTRSEARYRALVQAASQIIWSTDAEGGMVEDAPSWTTFTGQTFEATRGYRWLQAVHPDDRLEVEREWLGAVGRRGELDTEFRLYHQASGRYRWVHVRAVPLRNEDETLTGYVAMASDIEDRVQAEEALQRSQVRFQQAFHAGPFAASISTLSDDRFLEVNESFLELSGYAKDEVLFKTAQELGMWSSQEDQAKLEAATEEGQGFHELELSLKTKDGEVKSILSSGEKIRIDGEHGWLKMFIDISARKRTEEELMKAIGEVMSDTAWFSQQVVQRLANVRSGEPEKQPVDLTPRERQVLERIAVGKSDPEICDELGLTRQTVRNYVTNVYSKINVNSRAQAVVWARERGIVG